MCGGRAGVVCRLRAGRALRVFLAKTTHELGVTAGMGS